MQTDKIFRRTRRAVLGTVILACFVAACNKEKHPAIASEKTPMRYSLPQGNAPFDPRIVDFFNRYDSYILYKFSDVDFNYNLSFNLASPPVGNGNGKPGPAVVRTADSISIEAALDFMDQYWFAFYPEEFKKKYLPQKIMLAAAIYNTRWNGTTKIYDTPRVNPILIPVEGVDHITIPKVDTPFASMTLAQKLTLKMHLNKVFLKHLMYPLVNTVPALIPEPTDFFKVSDYGLSILTAANKYKYGFVTTHSVVSRSPDPMNDLTSFLDTICGKPKSALDAYMLSPNVDSLGLTRTKYNILVNYFQRNYNVDIQAIGNKQD